MPASTRYPCTEYPRPWKLFTLAAGIALLVIGALRDIAPDWDIPISFIMALLAYLTAPWSLRELSHEFSGGRSQGWGG